MTTHATKPCNDCGKPHPYEPMLISGYDYGKSLEPYCQACQQAAAEREQREKNQAIAEKIAEAIRSTIPPELRETDTKHPDFNSDLWAAIREWSPRPEQRWLGLIGSAGQCKTRCLALKTKQLIRKGVRVQWTSATHLQSLIEDRNARTSQASVIAANEHLAACKSAPYLILDDLGKNTWSPSYERHMFDILDHRRNYQLPTLWSANCHPDEFEGLSKNNANPIIGRIIEKCLIIHV